MGINLCNKKENMGHKIRKGTKDYENRSHWRGGGQNRGKYFWGGKSPG